MALTHQMSLRVSDELRNIIRAKQDELRSSGKRNATEADAARAIICEAKTRIKSKMRAS